MLKTVGTIVLSVALSSSMFGLDKKDGEKKSMSGYVVDAMCSKGIAKNENPMEKAAKHTKGCALEEGCAASGFGVFSDGKFYKFDEAGDKLALELIQSSKTQKGLMVEVMGEMMEEKFVVASMKEVMAANDSVKEEEKKAEKKSE